jgi:hypothetical protein
MSGEGESVRAEVRDYLACDDHGDRAEGVCGVCGTPVCADGRSEIRDVTLPAYERGGGRRLLYGLVLIVGPPLLLSVLFPRLLGTLTRSLFDKPLYLKGGLVPSLILVGLALLIGLRYRYADRAYADRRAFVLPYTDRAFDLLVRRSIRRTVCLECKRIKRRQRYVRYAVAVIAGSLVLYGLYYSVSGLFFRPLRFAGVGAALYVVREEVIAVVSSTI